MILSIFYHPKPYYKLVSSVFVYNTLLLVFPVLVSAQYVNNQFHVGSNPLVTGVAVGIATVFVIVIFIVLNLCCQSQREHQARADDGPTQQARKGLDQTVIETFPVFKYSEVAAHQTHSGPLECAVCLSQFEHDDQLRLLPKCNHVFHVECLDPWLKGQSTCPLCRVDLVPETIKLEREQLGLANGPGGEASEGRNDGNNNNNVGEVRVDIEEGHMAGKHKRWKSTGHVAEAEMVEGECWKKFTLMLPEKEMMMKFGEVTTKSKRTKSSIY